MSNKGLTGLLIILLAAFPVMPNWIAAPSPEPCWTPVARPSRTPVS